MRSAFSKYLAAAGAAATLMALCTVLAVSGGAAREDPAGDDTLTVGQCVGDSVDSSLEPFEKSLIKGGTIKEGLPRTKITKDMCAHILERAKGGTPVQKLIAAQNYVQEIELISDPTVGEVRVGSTGPLADGLLPAAIERLAKRHPRIEVHAADSESIERTSEGFRRKYPPSGSLDSMLVDDILDATVRLEPR